MAIPVLGAMRRLIRRLGVDVVRVTPQTAQPVPPDLDAAAVETIRQVRPYTMTSPERLYALIQAVRYLSAASIPGDIVECGVWRGGSMMAAARTLLECDEVGRGLHLFDTFEGMSAPTERDVAPDGSTAEALLRTSDRDDPTSAWCYATQDDVAATMARSGYPAHRVHLAKGKVEDTIPGAAPASIALLRLDTDWYESTRHELEHLYPRLSPGGVLIIDDYGHWAGCRQAVDEYFAAHGVHVLLNRIDYTGRIAVKPR
jgi:hypothetical protein